jgi:hypothetical protein
VPVSLSQRVLDSARPGYQKNLTKYEKKGGLQLSVRQGGDVKLWEWTIAQWRTTIAVYDAQEPLLAATAHASATHAQE